MPSNVIAAISDNSEHRTLTITYPGTRGTYRYDNVTPEEWDELRAAPSKEAYLNHTFKERQHPYERVPSSQGIHRVK
ncbi:KTSC domain-containing protein [Edaphobacter aggregans]|uniref:KTSC domain-containing protein n=1 Tax=Edaphobacter aggregans TaxID=570835 RepID=UPI00054F685E|nr:KTSC domain-containing protein [Edaphobacter aggregans]